MTVVDDAAGLDIRVRAVGTDGAGEWAGQAGSVRDGHPDERARFGRAVRSASQGVFMWPESANADGYELLVIAAGGAEPGTVTSIGAKQHCAGGTCTVRLRPSSATPSIPTHDARASGPEAGTRHRSRSVAGDEGAGVRTYEDAEDGDTAGWTVYDRSPSGASIANVADAETGSRVIELGGSELSNGFRLGATSTEEGGWNDTAGTVLSWRMNSPGPWVVYVAVDTARGFRYLRYDHGAREAVHGAYVQYGLGAGTVGSWQTIVRDLSADLTGLEPDNALVAVQGFLVRGSPRVDDVRLGDAVAIDPPPAAIVSADVAPVAGAAADGGAARDGALRVDCSVGADAGGPITAWRWTDDSGTVLSGEPSLDWTPTTSGTQRLTLRVTGDDGASADATLDVDVEGRVDVAEPASDDAAGAAAEPAPDAGTIETGTPDGVEAETPDVETPEGPETAETIDAAGSPEEVEAPEAAQAVEQPDAPTAPADAAGPGRWPAGASDDLPLAGIFYGNASSGLTTANASIATESSRRFRAERSGAVEAVRYHNRLLTDAIIESRCRSSGPGSDWCKCKDAGLDAFSCGYTLGSSYSVGNGGLISIQIRPDDGEGRPADTVLGTTDPFVPSDFEQNTYIAPEFRDPVQLTAGRRYHLVYVNDRPPLECRLFRETFEKARSCDRSRGAIGLNGGLHSGQSVETGRYGPLRGDFASANLYRHYPGDPWTVHENKLSFFELRYTDGVAVGESYHALDSLKAGERVIEGPRRARQRFTVRDATRRVDGVWLDHGNAPGANGRPLEVVLRGADGAALATGRLERAERCMALHGSATSFEERECRVWSRTGFGRTVELLEGETYTLELAADEGAGFELSTFQSLSYHGFTDRNDWVDARAETSADGGASWGEWTSQKGEERDLGLLFTIEGMPRKLP